MPAHWSRLTAQLIPTRRDRDDHAHRHDGLDTDGAAVLDQMITVVREPRPAGLRLPLWAAGVAASSPVADSGWRPSLSGRGMVGELLTDVSSWHVLLCYLDAAAWIGVPPAWPPATRVPGTDFGRLAATAIGALAQGRPDRREVRAAVILNEAVQWLTRPPAVTAADAEVLGIAAVYVRALCPVPDQPAALALLDVGSLDAERARQRRRHPIRALRRPDWPHLLQVVTWQQSLWWHRAQQEPGRAPLVHASAGIAASVWSTLGPQHDPIGIRHELRNRIINGRASAAGGDLCT